MRMALSPGALKKRVFCILRLKNSFIGSENTSGGVNSVTSVALKILICSTVLQAFNQDA